MRKIISVVLSAVMVVSCAASYGLIGYAAETDEFETATGLTSADGLWEYNTLEDGSAEICECKAGDSSLVIPEEVDGFVVSGIASAAFFDNTEIVSVTVPATVTEIGWWAFYGCSKLNEVIFSEGLRAVGYGAFMNCPELMSVALPMSIDKIGYDCFAYCCETTIDIYDSYSDSKISTQDYTKKSDFTLCGYSGTYAQKYAEDEDIEFTSLGEVKFGDTNLDGNIDADDIDVIKNYIKDGCDFTAIQLRNADIDNSGTVNNDDISILEKYLDNDYSAKAFPAAKSQYSGDNYLYGKSVYSNGDSIAKGGGTNIMGEKFCSYCNIIADKNNMKLTQKAVGGKTIAVIDGRTRDNRSLAELIPEMTGSYDFILLGGGYNDYFQRLEIGSVTPDFDRSGDYDVYTVAGALEKICYFLNENYSDTPVLYVICHKKYTNVVINDYWETIRQALKKWDIPYIDISEETDFCNFNDTISNQYFKYSENLGKGDGTHPLKYGHEKIYAPLVEAKMNEILAERETVTASEESVTLEVGESCEIYAKSDQTDEKLDCAYSSSNPMVAEVDGNGNITAKAPGTAKIKLCTSLNKTAVCTVKVNGSASLSTDDEAQFGDVNLDGTVNVKDSTFIQRIVVEEEGLIVTERQKALADIDGDGTINVRDATVLQKIIVNL